MKYDPNFLSQFFVLLGAVLISALSHGACPNRLKDRHHEVWVGLGRPTMLRQEFEYFIPLLLFFYLGKFVGFSDKWLTFFSVVRLSSDVVGIGMFIFLFARTFAW